MTVPPESHTTDSFAELSGGTVLLNNSDLCSTCNCWEKSASKEFSTTGNATGRAAVSSALGRRAESTMFPQISGA